MRAKASRKGKETFDKTETPFAGADRSEASGGGHPGRLVGTPHHAFMNQKIMPMSATRSLVTGVGSPAKTVESLI
jgi:hypothetical protein